MQTQSHLLLTAFVADRAKHKTTMPIIMTALLVGAVLPDIPFTLLTIAGMVWFSWFVPLPVADTSVADTSVTGLSVMEYLHFDLFFNDPFWIISHNTFHSLVVNALLIGLGWWAIRQQAKWGYPLFWLAVSTQAHTVIDIVTHNADGPLLFFPLNWHYRFQSPISYWEAAHYGWAFMTFEYTINIALLIYFGVRWWRRSKSKSTT